MYIFYEKAWICARRTTDHDLISVIPDKKDNRQEREREVKNEPCKSATVVNFCGLSVFLINKSCKIFPVNSHHLRNGFQ